ncbi:hypothetical protein [Nocardia xishanensis]
MDPAWFAVPGAVTAAAITASAAVYAPLRTQRHKERTDDRLLTQLEQKQKIDTVNEARVACLAWLTYLQRVAGDALEGTFITIENFDKRSGELRASAELAFANLVHAGVRTLQ